MPPSGVSPDSLLQDYQTLPPWIAWMFIGFACLGLLTFLVFLWHECFPPPRRRNVLPEPPRIRFAQLPVIRIVLPTHRGAAPVGTEHGDEAA